MQEQLLLRADGLELDPAARKVLQNGKKLDLTDVEFALLEALMRSPGKVVIARGTVRERAGAQISIPSTAASTCT